MCSIIALDIYCVSKKSVFQKEEVYPVEIDQRQWSRYENEINEFPIRYLKQICRQYNVSADELLGLELADKKEK